MTARRKLVLSTALAAMLGVVVGSAADRAAGGDRQKSEAKTALDAVKKAFPDAQVRGAEREREQVPVILYEVGIVQGDKRAEVLVATDGTIVALSRKLAKADLPEPILAAATKLAKKGKVTEVEKLQVRATPRFTPLDKFRIAYKVEVHRGGREYEVMLNEEGKILSAVVDDDDDDGDDGDDDDGPDDDDDGPDDDD